MKKVIFTLIALSMMACGCESTSKINPASKGKNIESVSGQVAGHDYVDLGLPSGTKWATCNVGATKPTEYGDYFAWGETKPKKVYSWDTYNWTTDGGDTFTKYNTKSSYGTVDNRTVLESADDAATANWGSAWRMPTLDEIKELLDGCNWKWVEDFEGSGVNGQLLTSKANGNTIFLPAASGINDTFIYNAGDYGYYWSSSLSEYFSSNAHCITYYDVNTDRNSLGRYRGQSVRAVTK